MVSVHLGPSWFFGMDASLEAFAALIALLVTFAAFRVYRITSAKKYAFFTASFGMLTLSFLSRAITDAILEELFMRVPQQLIGQIFFFGYVTHILLALAAYLIIFIITHKIKDNRIIAALFLMFVPSLLLSSSYYLSFYGLSAVFLAFIAYTYYRNSKTVKTRAAKLVFAAFLLITLAQGFFLVEAVAANYWYVVAQITQAAGYLTLLAALLSTRK